MHVLERILIRFRMYGRKKVFVRCKRTYILNVLLLGTQYTEGTKKRTYWMIFSKTDFEFQNQLYIHVTTDTDLLKMVPVKKLLNFGNFCTLQLGF